LSWILYFDFDVITWKPLYVQSFNKRNWVPSEMLFPPPHKKTLFWQKYWLVFIFIFHTHKAWLELKNEIGWKTCLLILQFFLSPKIFFTEVQGFTCTPCTVFFHVQFSFMYSFLSPSLSPLLSTSPFSFIFLSCYFSCNLLSPLLSFSRFFPPSSTCIPSLPSTF